jgi:endoglucanase
MRTALVWLCLVGCGDHTAKPGDAPQSDSHDGPSGDAPAALGLTVVMGSGGTPGKLVDGAGNTVRLRGADRAGTEYECIAGALFDGPSDQASIDAMKTWHVNAVRIPLNEDCWLGINGVPAATSGQNYRDAIRAFVTLLEQNSMYVILDLHWAAPGTQVSNGQLGMADADHAPTFWSQVATDYAGDHAWVIFDLFNEPFITDWSCWLSGGACAKDASNATYTAAGMATLLDAVRATGADNVVILGGLGYSSDFSQWLSKVQSIPQLSNVAPSWHTYTFQSAQTMCPSQYNGYSTSQTCATGTQTAQNYGIPPLLAAGFPLIVGEIGIDVYSSSTSPYSTTQATQLATWLESMLTWLDGQGASYLAWDWNTEASPLLITNFDGTPTPYFGVTYQAHLH